MTTATFNVSAYSPKRQRLIMMLVRSLEAEQPEGLGEYRHLDELTADDYRAAFRLQQPVFKAKSLKNYER